MEGKNLPKTSKGYATKELLSMWRQLVAGTLPEDTPREKMIAMDDFLREFRLGLFSTHLPHTKPVRDD